MSSQEMKVRVTFTLDVDVENWKTARFRGEAPSVRDIRADVIEWAEEQLAASDMAGRECAVTVKSA